MAVDDGIETIVATPHVLRGRWRAVGQAELEAKLDALRQKIGGSPRLLLGSEVFFGHDIAEVLRGGKTILPLAGTRYVLIEFAANAVPPMVESPLFQLQLDGWTPLIAHPERNSVFQAKPELLAGLIEHGARTQITAGSLTGDFGSEAQMAAQQWLSAGLVHIIASDAHNPRKRPPRMTAARRAVEAIVGPDAADALTRRNPAAVVEGRPLDYEPEPRLRPPADGFLTRLKKFFR